MAAVPSPNIGRHQMETLIVERAWKDPDFKREFTTNPKATIEKYSGQKLPADVNILVHQEDAKTMHLTIPAPPPNLSELSDDELEKVAGGTDVTITAAIITLIGGLVGASISVANDQTRARAGW